MTSQTFVVFQMYIKKKRLLKRCEKGKGGASWRLRVAGVEGVGRAKEKKEKRKVTCCGSGARASAAVLQIG